MEKFLLIGFGILVIALRLAPISSGKRKAGVVLFPGIIALLIGIFLPLVIPSLANVLVNTVAQPLIIMGIIMLIQDSIERHPNNRWTLSYWVWWTVFLGALCIFIYTLYWSIWVQRQSIFTLFTIVIALLFIIWWIFRLHGIRTRLISSGQKQNTP